MPENLMDKIPPESAGVLLAMVTSTLRIIYDHKETRPLRVLLEALTCGALSLTAFYGIRAMGLDLDWAIFSGGAIGYLGPVAVRAFAMSAIGSRINKSD